MVYFLDRSVAVMLYLCLVLMSIVQAAPHKNSAISEDSFYDPPAGFEKLAPGKILRSRRLGSKALSAFLLPQNVDDAYQFLFRSTDSLGKPIAAATTLIVPHNADTSKLVSYQVMIDSPSPSCAPSHVLKTGAGLKGVITQAELLFMDSLLERGWYVNTADYEGPKAAFTAGALAGHGILDSIRAVLASGNLTQLRPDASVQTWGYSGGALASGWALQLQPSYAPELKIIGAALGGLPVDLNQTLNAVQGGPFAGLAPSGIVGLTNQYPELATYVDSIIKPEKKKAFYKVKELCLTRLVLNYAFQKMDDYVTRPDYTNAPVAKKALEANVLGRGKTAKTPKVPIFAYHAKNDEVVPFAPADNLYKKWCKNGATIEFVKDELSEHIVLFVTGAANAIMYLEDRFKGEAVHAGCSARTTITSLLDPGALRIFGKSVLDALVALLGGPLGPGHL